jgi:hypothetical protein
MSATEIPKRLTPTKETLRRLFAVSGNLCAFPHCLQIMMDAEGDFVGVVCHVEAAEPGGQRFNAASSNDARRSFDNLMLMCGQHHVKTDNVTKYPVETLQEMKHDHEAKFTNPEDVIGRSFYDVTESDEATIPVSLDRLYDVLGYAKDDSFLAEFQKFARELQAVPRPERELLAVIANRAKKWVIRFGALRSYTGKSERDLIDALKLLEEHDLVHVDVEDHLSLSDTEIQLNVGGMHIWRENVYLRATLLFCEKAPCDVKDVIVDLRFDVLDQ